jgi:hypothetical protein
MYPASDMCKLFLGCVLWSSLLLAGGSFVSAQSFTSSFDSPDELTHYQLYATGAATGTPPVSPSASGQLLYSSASGRLAEGGLVHTYGTITDVAAVYQGSMFDLTASNALTISAFLKTTGNPSPATATPGTIFQAGFSANNTTGLYGESGNAFISSRVYKVGIDTNAFRMQTQVKTSALGPTTAAMGTEDFPLESATWYKLSLTVTRSVIDDTFDYTTILENWGTTGASLVAVASGPFSGSFSNAELYDDSSVYAAFRSQEIKSIDALDSFSVIPEPGTALLLGPAVAWLLGRRSRRSVR